MSKNIVEYPMSVYDSPGIRYVTICCEEFKPIGVVVKDGEIYLRVEVERGDGDTEHELTIEIYGTGHIIPEAEKIEYIDTVESGCFIWHFFNADDEAAMEETEVKRLYIIYKYPIAETGSTELRLEHKFVRVLHSAMQNGVRMVWVLLELVQGGGQESVRTVCVNEKGKVELAE